MRLVDKGEARPRGQEQRQTGGEFEDETIRWKASDKIEFMRITITKPVVITMRVNTRRDAMMRTRVVMKIV